MDLFNQLLDIQFVLKLSVVLALAWIFHFQLKRSNPRWQVWLWRTSSVGIACLALTFVIPPYLHVPLIPATRFQSSDLVSASDKLSAEINFSSPERSQNINTDSDAMGLSIDPSEVNAKTHVNSPRRLAPGIEHTRLIKTAIVTIYFIVSICLLAKLLNAIRSANKLIASSDEAPDWVQHACIRMCESRKIVSIPVRVTKHFKSPALVGVFRSYILIPDILLEPEVSEQEICGAISHELSHAESHDLVWDLCISILTALIWPHPFAWKIRAAHRSACERVSDRVASDAFESIADYQRFLAKIAVRVVETNPSFGFGMAFRSNILNRLHALENCPSAEKLGSRAKACFVFSVILSLLLGISTLSQSPKMAMAQQVPPSDSEPVTETEDTSSRETDHSRPEKLQLSVLRKIDGIPIANAKVRFQLRADSENILHDTSTNENGVAFLHYPDGNGRLSRFSIEILCPGFVPYFVRFKRNLIGDAIPVDKTVSLETGKRIGGTIIDSENRPIEGAKISISLPASDAPFLTKFKLPPILSSSSGQWELDGAPIDCSNLQLHIDHPRFQIVNLPIQDSAEGRYVLPPLVKLTGVITNLDGNPVKNATIMVVRNEAPSIEPPVQVDDTGAFVAYSRSPSYSSITVISPGFRISRTLVPHTDRSKPITIKLHPIHFNQKTSFHVLNSKGSPIKGVIIQTRGWTVGKTDESGYAKVIHLSTAQEYDLIAEGYEPITIETFESQELTHTVELREKEIENK